MDYSIGKRIKYAIAVLLLLFFGSSELVATNCNNVHFVGNNFSVLEATKEHSIEEILLKSTAFEKAYNENLGFSKTNKWILLELKDFDICEDDFVFELTYPHLTEIQCYLVHDGGYERLKDVAAIGQRHDNRFAFSGSSQSIENPRLVILLKGGIFPISFYSFIWSEQEYYKNLGYSHQVMGVFFGSYFVLVFFLFLSLIYYRRRVLFYFFIYNLLFAIYLFFDVGSYWLLFPGLDVNEASMLLAVIPPSASIAGFLFLEKFYGFNMRKPLAFFIVVFAGLVFLAFLLSLPVFNLGVSFSVVYGYFIFFILILCVLLIMGFVAMRLILNASQRNLFLFIGIFFHMLGVLILVSNSMDILPTIHVKGFINFNNHYHINWYLPSLIFIGVILEIVVFLLMLFEGIKKGILEDTIVLTSYNVAKKESLNALLEGEQRVRSQINDSLNVNVIRPLLNVDLLLSSNNNNVYLRDEIHEVINEINLIVSNDHQAYDSNRSIKQWLERFLAKIRKLTDIQIVANIEDVNVEDIVVRDTVFKVIQEAINNIIKHARASSAEIKLIKNDSGLLLLTIEDNGKGLETQGLKKGTGLFSMYERVRNANGILSLVSKDNKGFKVTVEIPLDV